MLSDNHEVVANLTAEVAASKGASKPQKIECTTELEPKSWAQNEFNSTNAVGIGKPQWIVERMA